MHDLSTAPRTPSSASPTTARRPERIAEVPPLRRRPGGAGCAGETGPRRGVAAGAVDGGAPHPPSLSVRHRGPIATGTLPVHRSGQARRSDSAQGLSGGSWDCPIGRSLVGHGSGRFDESRVVAAGAACSGWPWRPMEGSLRRAQRDPVPGPYRCATARPAGTPRFVEDRLRAASPLVRGRHLGPALAARPGPTPTSPDGSSGAWSASTRRPAGHTSPRPAPVRPSRSSRKEDDAPAPPPR